MYSTAKDVHAAITSKLYQTNSNRKRTYRPEEIDEAFNDTMFKFIEERSVINPAAVGLDETVKRQDDLKDLKVSKHYIDVYMDVAGSTHSPLVYAVLPSNYYKFSALELGLNYDCNRVNHIIKNVDTHIYQMPFSVLTSPSEYTEDLIVMDGENIYNANALKVIVHNVAGQFIAVNSILASVAHLKGVSFYWEYYLDVFKPNSFIIVTDEAKTFELTRATGTVIIAQVNKQYVEFDYQTNMISPCELAQSKNLPLMRTNYYMNKNRQRRPLIELEAGKLRINYDVKYLPTGAHLTYIKKPILLNLKLNLMTDFKSHITEIVDLTVANLLKTIEGLQGAEAITIKNTQ